MMVDLIDEMSATVELAKQFGGIGTVGRSLGISEVAVRVVGFLGLTRISASGDCYEPSEDGPLAAVFPVADGPWDEVPEVYDLLAVRLNNSERFWTRLGNARVLGRWNISHATLLATWPIPGDSTAPLKVFKTPLGWLQSGCDGACLIDTSWAAYELSMVPRIEPQDWGHGQELHRSIYTPAHLPRIVQRQELQAAE